MSVTTLLLELNNGETEQELTEALRAVTQAVTLTQKAGTVALELKISPNGRRGNSVEVEANVKVKAPSFPPEASVYFVEEGGNLTKRDPRQPRLPLTEERPEELPVGSEGARV